MNSESQVNHRIILQAQSFSVGYDGEIVLSAEKMQVNGNVIALAGHNGAGKSTFMKALLGLLPLESGLLQARDEQTGEILKADKHMAFCPETGAVFADITVKEYIKLWCRLKAPHSDFYLREGADLLEALELKPLLKKKGRELSKGQKQRVQIAVGFFSQPKLFLFDEPFDGLDVQRTHELMHVIRSYTPKMAFLISSHRMDVVERLADQVIVLQEGGVRTFGGTPQVSRELCERMYAIDNASTPDELCQKLELAFPNSSAYTLGKSVRFATSAIPSHELEQCVRATDANGALMTQVNPTLTDAMSLHLRLLKSAPKDQ